MCHLQECKYSIIFYKTLSTFNFNEILLDILESNYNNYINTT